MASRCCATTWCWATARTSWRWPSAWWRRPRSSSRRAPRRRCGASPWRGSRGWGSPRASWCGRGSASAPWRVSRRHWPSGPCPRDAPSSATSRPSPRPSTSRWAPRRRRCCGWWARRCGPRTVRCWSSSPRWWGRRSSTRGCWRTWSAAAGSCRPWPRWRASSRCPSLPSPEDFLARLSLLVGAEAVVLYGSDSPEGPFVLVAQVGLEPALVEALPMPRGEWLSVELSARGVVLSSEAEEREWSALSAGRLVRSAAVPLLLGGQPGGLLQVLRGANPPFSAEEQRLLGTLAELLMMLLEQRRLRAESARQLTDSRLLLDLARTTATTLEVASILDVASDFLVKLLDVSNCFILLHDEQAGVLRGAAASVTHRDFFRGLVVPVDDPESLAARVARERRSISVPDLSKAGALGRRSLVQQLEQKAMLALPLTSREQLIGVVLLDDIRRPRLFPTAFIELAEATCGQIALAITNARLYESLWASYAELAAARAEMVKRERLAALGELSAIVAHEVRNPLGAIFNAVASLRHLLKPDGDTAMLLDILAEESDRLDRMVSDLLDYTRPREPIRQLEDVARMLQDAVEAAWKQQGSPSHITPTIEVEPQLPRVPLDRRHIRQVLINMLVNAMQAMPQGGGVRVLARRELHEDRELLRIDVVDQGCGIPTELLHRVFEPFFTTKAQGTGLGLAVVKRIIEEHHGELSLESTPGRGTTFSIRLPLNQPTSPP
ncbi:sensor histidine kinase [Cystobacter fuscus]